MRLLLPCALLILIFAWPPAVGRMQDSPPDICQQAENIMPNCNFNNGTNGWQTFTEDGSASFDVLQGGGECHAPLCPAGHIVVEGHFVGGIYQQVPVAKGNTYYANIVWLVFDSLSNDNSINSTVGGIGRKMGIDPFGGTDSRSPNIVWGGENTRNDCKICSNQEVTATAQADTITVFLRIDDRWKIHAAEKGYNVPPSKDQFWLDDFGVKQVDGSAVPAPTAPPPTDTPPPPPPPTNTPVAEPPTATPVPATEEIQAEAPAVLADAPTAEIAQAASPEAEPVSPVATPPPSPGKTIAPPPTLTPSATPSPTATFEPKKRIQQPLVTRTSRTALEPAAAGLSSVGLWGVAGTTVCIGGAALILLGAVMGGLVWLYRLGWGQTDDSDPEEEEIVIDVDTL